MILRSWRGYADPDRPDAYPQHFRNLVIDELRGVAGFLGAELLRRDHDDMIEFTVLSWWSSMDAVRRFAGTDVERAVVAPDAAAALRKFDGFVVHHEVVERVVVEPS